MALQEDTRPQLVTDTIDLTDAPVAIEGLSEDAARERLKGVLTIDFVDVMPRDPNGKVRKQPIRDRYWQGRTRRI